MEREEIRKLIESYAESKVESILKEIEDCDSFKNQDFEFIEYDWLMSGDKLWMIIKAYDIDEKEIEQYYDVEKGYSFTRDADACSVFVIKDQNNNDKRKLLVEQIKKRKIAILTLKEFEKLVGYEENYAFNDKVFLAGYYETKLWKQKQKKSSQGDPGTFCLT